MAVYPQKATIYSEFLLDIILPMIYIIYIRGQGNLACQKGHKIMRLYIAKVVGGKYDYQFYFASEHRAGSKANREDCMNQWRKSHGTRAARNYKPVVIYRDANEQ